VTGDTTIVFGVSVPSTDPVFLTIVRFHILVGRCVAGGNRLLRRPLKATRFAGTLCAALTGRGAGWGRLERDGVGWLRLSND